MSSTEELTTSDLARMAGCGEPPENSPGEAFLRNVHDAAREAWEYAVADLGPDVEAWEHRGYGHEVADNAPSVYTYRRWREFVDLGAWTWADEAVEDGLAGALGPDFTTTDLAGVALYVIADRLIRALVEEWAE